MALHKLFCWDLRKGSKRKKARGKGITFQGSKRVPKLKKKCIFYTCKWICLCSSHIEILFPLQLREEIQEQILKSRNPTGFGSKRLPGILNTLFVHLFELIFMFPQLPAFYETLFLSTTPLPTVVPQNFYTGGIKISSVVPRESQGTCLKIISIASAWRLLRSHVSLG